MAFEQSLAQQRVGGAPSFLVPQDRAQGLPHQVERAAFVAEHVSPAAGPGGHARGVPSEDHRPGAGDHDDPRFAAGRARQRDVRVVRNQIALRLDRFFGQRLLVVGTAAQAQARGLEQQRFRCADAAASAASRTLSVIAAMNFRRPSPAAA